MEDELTDWQYWRLQAKEHRNANAEKRTGQLKLACLKNGVTYTEFAKNSFRLTKVNYSTIDYYPPSGKLYCHATKRWNNKLITDPTDIITKLFT